MSASLDGGSTFTSGSYESSTYEDSLAREDNENDDEESESDYEEGSLASELSASGESVERGEESGVE